MIKLYGFDQGQGVQDPSPFVLKVHTFLRLAELEYETVITEATLQKLSAFLGAKTYFMGEQPNSMKNPSEINSWRQLVNSQYDGDQCLQIVWPIFV